MLLDLSLTTNLLKTARSIAQTIIPPQVIDRVIQLDYEEMYSDTLSYLLEAFDDEGLDVSLEELECDFDRLFCSHYTKIKAFHACRITNESSYKKFGLRGINKDLLLELALERFGTYETPERIRAACEKTEIPSFDEAVFFFPALLNAKDPSQNHYLKCGSEMLQGLAGELGLGCQGILSSQGRSCIIECEIPLEQIQWVYRADFWRQVVTYSFQESAGRAFEQKAPDWGFATYGDVTPEYICSFHYVNDTDYKYTLLRH